MRPGSKLSLFVGALLVAAPMGLAQTATETDSYQQGSAPFTPTYTVPSGDLLQGLTPTTVVPNTGNFAQESAGGIPVLTDGTFGAIGSGVTGAHPAFATAGGTNGGQSLTYTLASPVTLTSVVTLGGWNDGGRDTQAYTVSYGIGGVFTPLATVNYDPTTSTSGVDSGTPTATQVVLNGFSIPGVDSLRFDFASAENGYQGYAELAATGTAVPEPATGGLAVLAAGLLTGLRRRKA